MFQLHLEWLNWSRSTADYVLNSFVRNLGYLMFKNSSFTIRKLNNSLN